MNKFPLALLVGLLLGQGPQVEAVPEGSVIECPQTIQVDQKASRVPAEWQAMATREDQSYRLTRASMFDGPPSNHRELKPTLASGEAKGTGRTLTFEFQGAYPDGVFVVCRYESTTVVTYKQVLPQPKKCAFTYRETARGLSPIRVSCQ